MCFKQICKVNGLKIRYISDPNLSLSLRHLIALTFLPSDEIPDAFREILPVIPPIVRKVVEWFHVNFISGNIRRGTPPRFPPELWSVYENLDLNLPRSQNHVEGWHSK